MDQQEGPSKNDYTRLNRALCGVLAVFLSMIWIGFLITPSDERLIEALLCVLYSSIPVAGLLLLFFKPVTPESDPRCERYGKGATVGRRAAFWLGVGTIAAGVVCYFVTDRDLADGTTLLLCVGGLILVFWSSRFPKIPKRGFS